MFLNPKMNLFVFNFSRDFIPTEIRDKYYRYLNRVPGNLIDEPIDFLNYSIQTCNLPGLNYSNVEQLRHFGYKDLFRTSTHPKELYAKELNVSLRLTDSFLNYWIMVDVFNYYYSYKTKVPYIGDQEIQILDGDGNVVTTIKLLKVLFTSIGDLSLNYSSNNPDFNSFDIGLIYNELEIKQNFDSAY